MTRFQDEYARAVKKYGLERGIRGSKARHRSQHEYYRQCQIDKRILEQDLSSLSDEKKRIGEGMAGLEADRKKLEKDTRILKVQKSQYEEYNLRVRKENGELTEQKDKLQAATSSLTARLSDLVDKHDGYCPKKCV